ncbi:flavin reductase family protein [Hoyosella rhizosphaerae]|uniref:flavin reductase family protein n=1 Tax=Hoyosella rhizosphaerae TaxID=1755582 RepID=UPI003558B026
MRTHFDTTVMDADRVYQLLTSAVVPRPIAWVSTRSADGVDNLAPYSFFTIASTNPPIVQFTSVGRKDSVRNVRETGEFVVNFASQPLIDQVNNSSAAFDSAVSEFTELDIRVAPSVKVAPLRVKEAPISLECVLEQIVEIGDSVIVFGRVVFATANSSVLDDDGLPDSRAIAPLSRFGRTEWGLGAEIRDVARPSPPPTR